MQGTAGPLAPLGRSQVSGGTRSHTGPVSGQLGRSRGLALCVSLAPLGHSRDHWATLWASLSGPHSHHWATLGAALPSRAPLARRASDWVSLALNMRLSRKSGLLCGTLFISPARLPHRGY